MSTLASGICGAWCLSVFNLHRARCFELPLSHELTSQRFSPRQTQFIPAHHGQAAGWLSLAAVGFYAD